VRKKLVSVIAGALLVVMAPSTAFAALVAEWKMDEPAGASIMTDSRSLGGANNGTIGSVVTGVPPLISGTAYQFDGATSYVSVPDNASLDPGAANITVQATVKVEDGEILDDSYDIIRKGVTTTAGGNWKMEIKRSNSDTSLGRLLCVFKGVVSGGTRVAVQRVANVDIVDSRAHTLRCIKTSTSVTAVVDGRSFTNAKAAGSIANEQPIVLGSKVAGDDVLQGVLDQVSISIG
jgi:hypothetical protein